jgi:MOSC domain-containing protein YiiM
MALAAGAWAAHGYPVYYGALGENLTTRGLDPREMRAGQRFRVGQAVIELTQVRGPCKSLDVYGPEIKNEIYDAAVKAGDTSSPRWARSGFYAAVVRPGPVRTHDIIGLSDAAV